jgi:hypothetical protein
MDKAEAKREYKESTRPMGIYRIRNLQSGKSYVGYGLDLPAKLNRHKAEFKFGSHRNPELLAEWKSLGEAAFTFEVLDELELDKDSKADPMEELRLLNEMWIGKLEKSGSVVVSL